MIGDFLKSYDWAAAGVKFKKKFLDQFNNIDGCYTVNPVHTQVDVAKVPWYEDVRLIRITDRNWDDARLALYYLLLGENQWFRLNGTSPPIHEINAISELQISEEYVIDYLKFFCFFVHGDNGPFYVLESMQDSALSEGLDESSQAHYTDLLSPAKCEGSDDKGNYKCSAVICYSDALFHADFEIKSSGFIEMLNDDMLDDDLPFYIDAPIVFKSLA